MRPTATTAVSATALAGIIAIGFTTQPQHEVPQRSRVALEVFCSGIGPDELAALGCNASQCDALLRAAQSDADRFVELEQIQNQLSDADQAIRDLSRKLRGPVEPDPQLVLDLENARQSRQSLVAAIRGHRGQIRQEIMASIPASQSVEARVVAGDGSPVAAPWRAGAINPRDEQGIADALLIVEEENNGTDAEAVAVLNTHRARPETAASLSNFAANAVDVRSVFNNWLADR